MIFSVSEIEILCLFYSGSRKATIETLKKAAGEMNAMGAKRRDAVRGALKKLERMRDGEAACIQLDP